MSKKEKLSRSLQSLLGGVIGIEVEVGQDVIIKVNPEDVQPSDHQPRQLASGLLTGKYDVGIPPDTRATLKGYEWLAERLTDPAKLATVRRLAPIAADLDCTLAQMALAWCLKNPRVSTVITGASRPAQVVENMAALDVVAKLAPDVMTAIDGVMGSE